MEAQITEHTASTSRVRGDNRLASESSPYLLSHAGNPVDWYPWGAEAFEKATRENKPIFLSIGYSSCHWCHVMEKESFEDEYVAELLNNDFVAVKVDREERPEVDRVYMDIAYAMTGSGGWPLSMILTPDKKPFYAATYIPKESVFGRVGMVDLLPLACEAWKNKPLEVALRADVLVESIFNRISNPSLKNTDDKESALLAFEELKLSFDAEYGGFGRGMKFPMPHQLLFLLRYYQKNWKRNCPFHGRENSRCNEAWRHLRSFRVRFSQVFN